MVITSYLYRQNHRFTLDYLRLTSQFTTSARIFGSKHKTRARTQWPTAAWAKSGQGCLISSLAISSQSLGEGINDAPHPAQHLLFCFHLQEALPNMAASHGRQTAVLSNHPFQQNPVQMTFVYKKNPDYENTQTFVKLRKLKKFAQS